MFMKYYNIKIRYAVCYKCRNCKLSPCLSWVYQKAVPVIVKEKKTNYIDHLIKFEYYVVIIIQQFLDRLKLR